MNRVRNVAVAIGVGLVFICCVMIISVVTKEPQKAYDFSYHTTEGKVTGLFTEAREQGAVLIFFDPELEGSNDVMSRVTEISGDVPVIAVSVKDIDEKEQAALLPENVQANTNIVYDGAEILELYNIGNAPVTYFIDSRFYVQDAFVGNIKDKTIEKCIEKLKAE